MILYEQLLFNFLIFRFQNFVEADKFDYFTLSLQWPVTFCRLNKARVSMKLLFTWLCCFFSILNLHLAISFDILFQCKMSLMPEFWTIHGLWLVKSPSYKSNN